MDSYMDHEVDNRRTSLQVRYCGLLGSSTFSQFENKGYQTRLHFINIVSDAKFHFALDAEKAGGHLSYGSPKAGTYLSAIRHFIICWHIQSVL